MRDGFSAVDQWAASNRCGTDCPIIIAGMHRSGTSLVGALLASAGVNLGARLLPADKYNPNGYFEDAEILALNREMLQMASRGGQAGHPDWGWTEDEHLDLGALESFRDRAGELVEARARSAITEWGWKDPRTTLLLDFWDSLVPHARYLFVYRRPWDVADSMQRLGAEVFLRRPDYAWLIWIFYNRRLLKFHTLNRNRAVLVSAEMVQRQPGRLFDLLETRFGLDVSLARLNAPRLIDPDLFQTHDEDDPLVALASAANRNAAVLLDELDKATDLPVERVKTSSRSCTKLTPTPLIAPPRLSVVIPCYNQGEYLAEAVASVERSVEEPCDLIIVNDGSTEGRTHEVLDVLRSAGYYVIDQENSGLSAARNRGIEAARGEYVLPLDADNRLRPGFISAAHNVLDVRSDVGVVYSDRHDFGLRNETVDVPPFDPILLLPFNCIDACALLRKEVWGACGGYDPKASPWEDWDLWIGAIERGWLFHHAEVIGFDYRVRPNSMLSADNDEALRRGLYEHVITKHQDLYRRRLPEILLAAQQYGTDLRHLARKHESLCAEIAEERVRLERENKTAKEPLEAETSEGSAAVLPQVETAPKGLATSVIHPFDQVPLHLPPLILPKQINDKKERLDAMLSQVREIVCGGWKASRLFRPFLRRRRLNVLVLKALTQLAKTNASLVNRVHHLTACVQTQNGLIALVANARDSDGACLKIVGEAVSVCSGGVQDLRARFGELNDLIVGLQVQRAQAAASSADLAARTQAQNEDIFGQLSSFREELGRSSEQAVAFEAKTDALCIQIENVEGRTDATAIHIGSLQSQLESLGTHIRNLQGQTDALGTHVVNLSNDTRPSIDRLEVVQTELERLRQQTNWIGRHINSLKVLPRIIELDNQSSATRGH